MSSEIPSVQYTSSQVMKFVRELDEPTYRAISALPMAKREALFKRCSETLDATAIRDEVRSGRHLTTAKR